MVILLLTGLFSWAAFWWYSAVALVRHPTMLNLLIFGFINLLLALIMLDYSPNDICETIR